MTTRAISVDAPPSAIWPWLAQMGSGRGGAYSYDWIENLLGLNMHSADRIPSSSLAPVSRLFFPLLMERKMLIGIKQRAERTAP